MTPATTLAELVPNAAEARASATAIRDAGRSWTWSEVAEATGRLATALAHVGVGIGDRVAVLHHKSADAFIAMHGIVQHGAVAVPIDPRASVDYAASVLAEARCTVLVTHEPAADTGRALAARGELTAVLGITAGADDRADDRADDGDSGRTRFVDRAAIEAFGPASPLSVDADHPAYVITTSGSTGRPKGICHSHASALAYVAFKRAAYDFGSDDRIGDLAPNHFDISTQALWVTPAVGACNIVVPEPYQMLPASLAELMANEAMTVWYGVPYLLGQLLTRGNLGQHDLTALRWVLFGGEVIAPSVVAELMAQLPTTRFSNVYGPAEVNACAVHHLPGPPTSDEPIPIGDAVDRTRVRLLDGEIQVSGPTTMLGYLDRPDLDEQAFVFDQASRWYRTGDLGHRRPDGALVFDGRVDHQVKIRGHRVELEAVEAALEDHPAIVAAVVAPVGDVLVAGVMTVDGGTPDQSELLSHLGQRLPPYAVPARVEPIRSAPTTGSGKLDRRMIRAGMSAPSSAEGRQSHA